MPTLIALVCLLTPVVTPVIPDRNKEHAEVIQGHPEQVMQIKSGVEIVIKRAGVPTTIRLLGIDTPLKSPNARVNRLNQMRFLRGLIAIGDWVRLETEGGAETDAEGHQLAHVYRASDGLWLNQEMAEQGFATTTQTYACRKLPAIEAAVRRSQDAQRGMWATDYLEHAVKPATFSRTRRLRYISSPMAPTFVGYPVPFQEPVQVPVNAGNYGNTYGYGYGYGNPYGYGNVTNPVNEIEPALQNQSNPNNGGSSGSSTVGSAQGAGQGVATVNVIENAYKGSLPGSTGFTPVAPFTGAPRR